MNFKEIKKEIKEKGVLGETILVDKKGKERMIIGFNRQGRLVTDDFSGVGSMAWAEATIIEWAIKQEPKKLYAYELNTIVIFRSELTGNDDHARLPEYDIEYK